MLTGGRVAAAHASHRALACECTKGEQRERMVPSLLSIGFVLQ